jgi:putative addiction module killer protein
LYPLGYNATIEIEIELYELAAGHCPFDDWFESLRELNTRAKILTRLDRLKVGNLGAFQVERVYGPGMRVYYSKIGNKIVLLLCGGDKSSQTKDINKAKEYLKEYQAREKKNGKK